MSTENWPTAEEIYKKQLQNEIAKEEEWDETKQKEVVSNVIFAALTQLGKLKSGKQVEVQFCKSIEDKAQNWSVCELTKKKFNVHLKQSETAPAVLTISALGSPAKLM